MEEVSSSPMQARLKEMASTAAVIKLSAVVDVVRHGVGGMPSCTRLDVRDAVVKKKMSFCFS